MVNTARYALRRIIEWPPQATDSLDLRPRDELRAPATRRPSVPRVFGCAGAPGALWQRRLRSLLRRGRNRPKPGIAHRGEEQGRRGVPKLRVDVFVRH